MDRNRSRQPGHQLPSGPNRSTPAATNTSIFGLISTVNKGILKNSSTDRRQPSNAPPNPSSRRGGPASKLPKSDSDKSEPVDKHRQDAFLLAKSKVEDIQKGLWKSNQAGKKSESSRESFKVPQLPTRPVKQGQIMSSVSDKDVRDKSRLSGQQSKDMSQTKAPVSLVEYEDDDHEDQPKRGGSFSRSKALEEIDRYRAVGSGGRISADDKDVYREAAGVEEREEYYDYRKDRYDPLDPGSITGSKSREIPSYDPYRKSGPESSNRYADELKEDDKYFSKCEVFDYGHTSDYGNTPEIKESGEKGVKSRFEETGGKGRKSKFEETGGREVKSRFEGRGVKSSERGVKSRFDETGEMGIKSRFEEIDERGVELKFEETGERGVKSSERGVKSRFEETSEKRVKSRFEETKETARAMKDTDNVYGRVYSKGNYESSRDIEKNRQSYPQEVFRSQQSTSPEAFRNQQVDSQVAFGKQQSDFQHMNQKRDSYREQYGYQRGYRGDVTESIGSRDEGPTMAGYSDEHGSGYGDRIQQLGQESQGSYSNYPRYDEYSDRRQDNRQVYGDANDRGYGSRYQETGSTFVNVGYDDRTPQFQEDYSQQGRNIPDSNDQKTRKPSGDMLYEDFLFGGKGQKPGMEKEKFDIVKDSQQFDEERERRFTEGGRSEAGNRQRSGDKNRRGGYGQTGRDKYDKDNGQKGRDKYDADRQGDYGQKGRDKYDRDNSQKGTDKYDRDNVDVNLSAADTSKPFYETRWASEKSETISSAWQDKQSDFSQPPPFMPSVPVSSMGVGSMGVAKTLLGPGILCKDCNIACLDTEVYEIHLKSDSHLLTLQKKAQELFQMSESTKSSRLSPADPPFYVTSGLPPCAPAAMVTVIPPKPKGPLQAESISCNSLMVSWSRLSVAEERMVERYHVEYRNARETHWVTVGTTSQHDYTVDGYVEYRNARETHWVTVGITSQHDYTVDGLQENTDYLFRVYATNGLEKSEVLESVLITTRRRKEMPPRRPRRPSPQRRRPSPERKKASPVRRRPSPDRRKSPERRRPSPDRRKPSPERRKTSKDRDKADRDRHRSSEKDARDKVRQPSQESERERGRRNSREIKKDDVSAKHKADDSSEKTGANKDVRKRTESESSGKRQTDNSSKEKPKTSAEEKDSPRDKSLPKDIKGEERKKSPDTEKPGKGDTEDDTKKKFGEDEKSMEGSGEGPREGAEEVECLLYREIPNIEEQPLLGLEYLWEIVSYKPTVPVRYLCKLCNTKGFASNVMLRHITGLPHKLEFFKKINMTVFDTISMIPSKKQQIERINYEGRLLEDKHGRGAVKVMIMLNPQDTGGKVTFKDPVEVKAPPPDRSRVTEPAPEVTMIRSMFKTYFDEAVRIHELEDIALIGMSYLKEYFHPTDEKECPRFICALCNITCSDRTVVFHMIGKKHRVAYMKTHFPEYWDLTTKSPDGKQMVIQKAKEIEEKQGSGQIRSMVAKNARLWRHNLKSKELISLAEEDDAMEEEGGTSSEAPPVIATETPIEVDREEENQGVKFGIKKNDPTSKNIKPVNVLEQAKPKTKEAFDWNKENAALQAKIQNQTVIKSSRKSKFITVYSEFFKRYPVIGLQWVTEFQKPDPKMEPWYMCFMCQHKLQWKNILDHVTSSSHRINYMKKSYEKKYQALLGAINTNKTRGRTVIESYSREIMQTEAPVSSMEVMLELNINKEALKSVMKVKDNLKTSTTAPTRWDKDQPGSKASTPVDSSSSAATPSVTAPVSTVSSTATPANQATPTTLSQPMIGPVQPQLPPLQPMIGPVQPTVTAAATVSAGHAPVVTPSVQPPVQQLPYQQQTALPTHAAVYSSMSTTMNYSPSPAPGSMGTYQANRFPMPFNNTGGMQPRLATPQAFPGQSQNSYSSPRFPQHFGGQSNFQRQHLRSPYRPPGMPQVTMAMPGFTHMAGQQQPWQTTMASNPAGFQPPNVSQNAPYNNPQTSLPYGSQTGLQQNQQMPGQTGFQQADGFQRVIEKQAEEALTQQILQTGQFPTPGTKVTLASDSSNKGNPVGQYQKAGDSFNVGEKRPAFRGTEAFEENKKARMEENNWQKSETRRQGPSRFDSPGNRSRSRSPARQQYDRDQDRGYNSGKNRRTEEWDDRGTESNRRTREYDRGFDNTPENDERYDAYQDLANLGDRDRDAYIEDRVDDQEYDIPLSSRELDNLVQMYNDRTDEDYEGVGDLEDAFERARSQDEYLDEGYDDFGNSRVDRETDAWSERDSYRRTGNRRGASPENLNRRDDNWEKEEFRRGRFDDDRTLRDSPDLRRDSERSRRSDRDSYDDDRRRNRSERGADYDCHDDDARRGTRRGFDDRKSTGSNRGSRYQSSERNSAGRDRGRSGSRGRDDRGRRERDRSPRSDSESSDRSARSRLREHERLRSDRFSGDDRETRSRHDRSRERDRWNRSEDSPQHDPDTRSRTERLRDLGFESRQRPLMTDDLDTARSGGLHGNDLQRGASYDRETRWPAEEESIPDPSREEIDKLLRKVNTSLMKMPAEVRQSLRADVARDMPHVMNKLDQVCPPGEGQDSYDRGDRSGPRDSSGRGERSAMRGGAGSRGRGSFISDSADRGSRSGPSGRDWERGSHDNSPVAVGDMMGAYMPQGRETFAATGSSIGGQDYGTHVGNIGVVAGQGFGGYGGLNEASGLGNEDNMAGNIAMVRGGAGGFVGGQGGEFVGSGGGGFLGGGVGGNASRGFVGGGARGSAGFARGRGGFVGNRGGRGGNGGFRGGRGGFNGGRGGQSGGPR